MTNPKRLFDCLDYLLAQGDKKDLLAAKEDGNWRTYTTPEIKMLVSRLCGGLLQAGIGYGDGTLEGRDKVAIISKNKPEWLVLDLAVQQSGAVLVPVYPTININELEFVLNDAQVKLVFVNNQEEYEKIVSIRERIPSIRDIYSFEKLGQCRYWKELLVALDETIEKKIREVSDRIQPADLATIIYTSGTTGTPKGVMLSHDNILSNVLACIPCLPAGNHKALSFLPLNHIYERMISYFYLFKGASIYYAESMETIGENLKEVRPTIFTTVPRLLEKVYDKIMSKGAELKGIKKKLFYWAHDLASKFEINQSQGAWYNLQLSIANKLVFSKWREALGNNLVCIVSGGAACQVRLIRLFTAARIPVLEGYGLTETSPVLTASRFEETGRMFGTVGPKIDNVELRIADDGEILCKGPNVMMGYYKRPDLTAEAIKDGWFYTGDIGELVNNEFLKITDRKKELFKTSGGKYVAPLPIENKLKESVFIEQVMVVGANRKFVGALIVPSFPNLLEWAKQNGVSADSDAELVRHPRVKELYRNLVDSFNVYFNHVEQVKKFELLSREWTIDGGEMTPKLSLKRKVVIEKYAGEIERLYQ